MIKLIACVDIDYGVSRCGEIPWSFDKDRLYFRDKTLNQVVIMGRRTMESLPHGFLPNRINCVISTKLDHCKNIHVFNSVEEALIKYDNPWIIGGASIYNYTLQHDLIDYALITVVRSKFMADKFIEKKYLESFEKKVLFEGGNYFILEFCKRVK